MRSFGSWKERVRALKKETFALYLACRHPRVPWYAKILALIVVGYALSPIDLIPDFIPILGYLDDMVLIPLGIMLVIRMIPAEVLAECRRKSEEIIEKSTRVGKFAAAVIVMIWIITAALVVLLIVRAAGEQGTIYEDGRIFRGRRGPPSLQSGRSVYRISEARPAKKKGYWSA